MTKREIQNTLKQFNTAIQVNIDGVTLKFWYCIDKYYISRLGFQDTTTVLKYIHEVVNKAESVEIVSLS